MVSREGSMSFEYRIDLLKHEHLLCDSCGRIQGEGSGWVWFTKWDDMKDCSKAFTHIICDECKNA